MTHDWLATAKQLGVGRSLRVPHCGEGKDAKASRPTTNKYTLHCFRCGHHEVHNERESFADLSARLLSAQRLDRVVPQSWDDVVRRTSIRWDCIPTEFRIWLLRAGIGAAEQQRLDIRYEEGGRLYIPSPCKRYWCARGPRGAEPKYVAPSPRVPDPVVWEPGHVRSSAVVLVEDLLSGWKVSEAGYTALSVCGTSLLPSYITMLLERSSPVVTWFDPDSGRQLGMRPGRVAAEKHGSTLKRLGLQVYDVLSEKDPKGHHLLEIRDYVDAVVAGG